METIRIQSSDYVRLLGAIDLDFGDDDFPDGEAIADAAEMLRKSFDERTAERDQFRVIAKQLKEARNEAQGRLKDIQKALHAPDQEHIVDAAMRIWNERGTAEIEVGSLAEMLADRRKEEIDAVLEGEADLLNSLKEVVGYDKIDEPTASDIVGKMADISTELKSAKLQIKEFEITHMLKNNNGEYLDKIRKIIGGEKALYCDDLVDAVGKIGIERDAQAVIAKPAEQARDTLAGYLREIGDAISVKPDPQPDRTRDQIEAWIARYNSTRPPEKKIKYYRLLKNSATGIWVSSLCRAGTDGAVGKTVICQRGRCYAEVAEAKLLGLLESRSFDDDLFNPDDLLNPDEE